MPETDPLDELLARVTQLLDRPGRAVLGIAGAPGAGKSTLTDTLLARLRHDLGTDAVGHLPMDGFHLADVQLDQADAGARERRTPLTSTATSPPCSACTRNRTGRSTSPVSSATSNSPSPRRSRSHRRRGS